MLVIVLQLSLPHLEAKVHFLDVGQGDSALIITTQYQKILIDGGPDDKALHELAQLLPFWDKTLDAIILSHADADHLRGLLPIARHFTVRNLYLGLVNDISPPLKELISLIKNRNGKVFFLQKDRDILLSPGMVLDVLAPFETEPAFAKVRNDASVVFQLITPKKKILFTGDISAKQENALVQRYGPYLRSDVLKVAHHGSASSSHKRFLTAINAGEAIISAGKNNPFRHPRPEVLMRLQESGAKILRTDLCGTISLQLEEVLTTAAC